jgi:ribosomal protein S18 acetylase RimI-like enzyme
MAEVGVAVAAADRVPALSRTAAEFAESFDAVEGQAPPCCLGAFASDGRLAAFGTLSVRTSADPVHLMPFNGMVHPEFRRRGAGTELLVRAAAAAAALHRQAFPDAPLELLVQMIDDVPGQAEAAVAAGFKPWRSSLEMSRELPEDADTLALPPPEGLELLGFAPEHIEALHAAHNAAFVPDHPGASAPSAQMWAARFTAESFRPDLSFLLRDGASRAVAGYLLANERRLDPLAKARNAHLMTIATLRAHRGRGVASALIGAALTAAVRGGYGTASLHVDAENPSGAVRVYKRAGFRAVRSATTHVRKIAV